MTFYGSFYRYACALWSLDGRTCTRFWQILAGYLSAVFCAWRLIYLLASGSRAIWGHSSLDYITMRWPLWRFSARLRRLAWMRSLFGISSAARLSARKFLAQPFCLSLLV